MKKRMLTLSLVLQGSRLLLGMKKRGFGEGRWNGFGGKVEPGETIEDAAARELFEEAGIQAQAMHKVGVLTFEFTANPTELLEAHVFGVGGYTGNPVETEEMRPAWFAVDNLPYANMWPDDIFWMPLFLAGKKFNGRFLFGEQDAILEQTLEEVLDTEDLSL